MSRLLTGLKNLLLVSSVLSGNSGYSSPGYQALASGSCQEMYRNPFVVKPSEQEIRVHGLGFTIGSLGLITSITATALTAGAASPGTLVLGAASIGLMTGGVGLEGYLLASPVSEVIRNKELDAILTSAALYTQNPEDPGTEKFLSFWKEHVWSEISKVSELPSPASTAGLLGHFNENEPGKLCEVISFQGELRFRYLSRDEMIENLLEAYNSSFQE